MRAHEDQLCKRLLERTAQPLKRARRVRQVLAGLQRSLDKDLTCESGADRLKRSAQVAPCTPLKETSLDVLCGGSCSTIVYQSTSWLSWSSIDSVEKSMVMKARPRT
jgi:hypothetical protein